MVARAGALYVVNGALGSFLLRADEVTDQVPMSACGHETVMAVQSPHVCCRGQSGVRRETGKE
jgi:hypothetical protein